MSSHGNRKSGPEEIPQAAQSQPPANPVKAEKNKAGEGSNKAFQEHDPANRQGSFEETGDHARTGNRGHQ